MQQPAKLFEAEKTGIDDMYQYCMYLYETTKEGEPDLAANFGHVGTLRDNDKKIEGPGEALNCVSPLNIVTLWHLHRWNTGAAFHLINNCLCFGQWDKFNNYCGWKIDTWLEHRDRSARILTRTSTRASSNAGTRSSETILSDVVILLSANLAGIVH